VEARYVFGIVLVLAYAAYALWAGSVRLNQWEFDRMASPVRYWAVITGLLLVVLLLAAKGLHFI
jgi:hypothetical protein